MCSCLLAGVSFATVAPIVSAEVPQILSWRVSVITPETHETEDQMQLEVSVKHPLDTTTNVIKPAEETDSGDLLKVAIAKTNFLRLVESDGSTTDDVDLELRYASARIVDQVEFLLSATNPLTSAVQFSTRQVESSIDEAIEKAVNALNASVLQETWTVRVKTIANGKILIARGERDGLREGMTLNGYSISTDLQGTKVSSDEIILLNEPAVGQYKVTSVRPEASVLEVIDDAPVLAVGDLLELSPLKLRGRGPTSSRKALMDTIYDSESEK